MHRYSPAHVACCLRPTIRWSHGRYRLSLEYLNLSELGQQLRRIFAAPLFSERFSMSTHHLLRGVYAITSLLALGLFVPSGAQAQDILKELEEAERNQEHGQ